jgi:polysaccharide biosynthesis protein PelG
MALFVFSIETEFFERYVEYYRDIERHANFARIRKNQRRIIEGIADCFGNVLVLAAGCGLLAILTAPRLFAALHINFTQIGMFRLGVLGAFFHVLALFLGILLSYLDLNRAVMRLHVFFFLANAALTALTLWIGFPYFGYGYFLASVLVFVASFVYAARCLDQLPYVSFVRANRAVQQAGRV